MFPRLHLRRGTSTHHRRQVRAALATALACAGASASTLPAAAAPGSTGATPSAAAPAQISTALSRLPVTFEENVGQTDGQVAFLSRHGGSTLFLARDRIVVSMRSTARPDRVQPRPSAGRGGAGRQTLAPTTKTTSVTVSFGGANPEPAITGLDEQPGKVNYFIGSDPAQWHANVPTFSRVEYHDLYPGIDLVFYGRGDGQPEYDWIVHPGADPSRISIRVDGSQSLRREADGGLSLATSLGAVRLSRPAAYQLAAHGRRVVGSDFVVEAHTSSVGLSVGTYDHTADLVIDPTLSFSSYLGGTGGNDVGRAVAVDTAGNVYVAGGAETTNFPTLNAFQSSGGGSTEDAFITKLTPLGTALVYSTYLGGTRNDEATAIAVDPSGAAYVTGWSGSRDFPLKNPIQAQFVDSGTISCAGLGVTCHPFATKLAPSGSSLVYSTYLGGSTWDIGYGIAIDTSGNAYVTGDTTPGDFPLVNSIPNMTAEPVFVCKINATGSAFTYSTVLGGASSNDEGLAIGVDRSGNAYITGETFSPNFPVTANALQPLYTAAQGSNGYVTKLGASGSAIVYSTFLGGSIRDWGYGIGVDSYGAVTVVGKTDSPDFPTVNAAQPTQSVTYGQDGFVSRLTPDGSGLVYSTYLGGSQTDEALGVAVTSAGYAFVTGDTTSTNFPLAGAIQTALGGSQNAFVTEVGPQGGPFLYSTYLGGTGHDIGNGVATDGLGDAIVTGSTTSANFPVTASAFQVVNNNQLHNTAFVTMINEGYQPLIGGVPTAAEGAGGGNYCWECVMRRLRQQQLVGDPVQTEFGSVTETHLDMFVPGRGTQLALTRTYDSTFASTSGSLGYGWTFNGGARLILNTPTTGSITVSQENGSQIVFNQQGSSYVPIAPRIIATLHPNPDGTFTLTRHAREQLVFSSAGKILSTSDLNGYTTTYGYNGSGQLAQITDQAGRSFTLHYTGATLTEVDDVAGGRKVLYGYNDGAGNLTDVTDVNGGVAHYGYDASHRLVTVDNPVARAVLPTGSHQVTNVYDTSGRAIQQTIKVSATDASLDRTTRFSYAGDPTSASGGTTTVTDPKGNVTVEQFVNGLRTAVTRGASTPQAATWQYAYDPLTAAVLALTDPNGHQTRWTYNPSGDPLTVTDPLQRVTVNTYDGLNDLTSTTDPRGVTTSMGYDGAGNIRTTSTPCPDCSPAGTQLTTYKYDDVQHPGDLTRMFDPDNQPDTAPTSSPWAYQYDAAGDRTSTTDPLGDKSITCFDAIGRVTSSTTPKGVAAGVACASAAPAAFTTYYTDDPFGDVLTTTDPLQHQTKRVYDADRNLTDVTDAATRTVHTTYDLADEVTAVTQGYGTALASTSMTDYWPDGTIEDQKVGGSVTSYGYDPFGRLTSVATPATAACGQSPCSTGYGYDSAGNRTSKQDPGGNCGAATPTGCTTWGYDPANEMTTITYSDATTQNVSNIAYDADGQLTGMTDGTGTSVWRWDSLHRMTLSQDGSGATVLYGYDLKGQLTSVTYPGGTNTVSRVYDNAGRLKSVSDWLGNTTRFSPDADSNMGTISYANGTTGQTGFDQADRLSSVTDTTTGSTPTMTYGRDNANQLTSVTSTGLPDTHSYTYTPLSQVAQVDGAGAYGYDLAGNPTSFPDATAQTFDPADELQTTGRITLVATGKNEATSSSALQVTFQATQGGSFQAAANDQILVAITIPGNQAVQTPGGYSVVASRETGTGALAAQTIVFRKQAAGNESSVTVTQTGSVLFQKTAVAAIYRGVDPQNTVDATATGIAAAFTSVPAGPVTASIAGDRLVMVEGAAANTTPANWSSSPTLPQPVTMTDEIHESDKALNATALADGFLPGAGTYGPVTATFGTTGNLVGILLALRPATTAYSFDARGERVAVTPPTGSPTTLAYDQAGRLCWVLPAATSQTACPTPPAGASTYTYNGDGLRLSKTVGGSTEHFTYDQAEGLPLILQDGSTQFVYGDAGKPMEAITPQPAISLVGSPAIGGNPATTTKTTATVTLPSGVQANDQIVLAVTFPAGLNNAITTPSGYTQVGQLVKSGGTAADVLAVYRKTAGASDSGATVTIPFSGPFASAAVAAAYRGVDPDPDNPIDVSSPGTTNGGPTVTPAVIGTRYSGEEWLVVQGASYVGTSTESWTAPSGLHEESPQANSNVTVTAGLADKAAAAPGTSGSLTSTFAVSGQLTTMFLGLKTPPQITFYHPDQLGSTRLLTDQAGQVVATFTYDPFGRLANQTGATTTALLYAGQYRDAESGFYYLRARYYDPSTAQMLTRDPLMALTREPYGYVNDNPLNGTDPSGLCGLWGNDTCWSHVESGVSSAWNATTSFVGSLCVRNPFGGNNGNGGCETTVSTSQGEGAIGVAVGVGATIASGGALAGASAFGLGSGGLALAGFGAGTGAAALDAQGCAHGDRLACVGLGLGLTGAAAGAPELLGSWLGLEEGSLAAEALHGLSAFGLNVGLAGTTVDFTQWVASLCGN